MITDIAGTARHKKKQKYTSQQKQTHKNLTNGNFLEGIATLAETETTGVANINGKNKGILKMLHSNTTKKGGNTNLCKPL